ncbi:hypothetical protein GCM10009609_17760 [Pseudonocardia aurantiaca]
MTATVAGAPSVPVASDHVSARPASPKAIPNVFIGMRSGDIGAATPATARRAAGEVRSCDGAGTSIGYDMSLPLDWIRMVPRN